MIVWLNGTHGVGKTTTSLLVQRLIPDSRVFDAEMIGEVLTNVERHFVLHAAAEVVDTTHAAAPEVARRIAAMVT